MNSSLDRGILEDYKRLRAQGEAIDHDHARLRGEIAALQEQLDGLRGMLEEGEKRSRAQTQRIVELEQQLSQRD